MDNSETKLVKEFKGFPVHTEFESGREYVVGMDMTPFADCIGDYMEWEDDDGCDEEGRRLTRYCCSMKIYDLAVALNELPKIRTAWQTGYREYKSLYINDEHVWCISEMKDDDFKYFALISLIQQGADINELDKKAVIESVAGVKRLLTHIKESFGIWKYEQ